MTRAHPTTRWALATFMLVLVAYICLLLIIVLDNYLSVFKRVGHEGFVNRLSLANQAIFWLLELAFAIAFIVTSLIAFGYLLGLLIGVAGLIFAFVFYIAAMKFFFTIKMRRERKQRMAAFEAEFQASQRDE
jgi:purine-cytosine permease-like protein